MKGRKEKPLGETDASLECQLHAFLVYLLVSQSKSQALVI